MIALAGFTSGKMVKSITKIEGIPKGGQRKTAGHPGMKTRKRLIDYAIRPAVPRGIPMNIIDQRAVILLLAEIDHENQIAP
jgi:hypothetical protein